MSQMIEFQSYYDNDVRRQRLVTAHTQLLQAVVMSGRYSEPKRTRSQAHGAE